MFHFLNLSIVFTVLFIHKVLEYAAWNISIFFSLSKEQWISSWVYGIHCRLSHTPHTSSENIARICDLMMFLFLSALLLFAPIKSIFSEREKKVRKNFRTSSRYQTEEEERGNECPHTLFMRSINFAIAIFTALGLVSLCPEYTVSHLMSWNLQQTVTKITKAIGK